jgi:FlaG/FlaF family flagellin (archaellin)
MKHMRKRMKLRKSFSGNVKAVSPVIATIIIVAIAITMSIAVAYWLLGLGSSMTRYEKVQFVSGYATGPAGTPSVYTINMVLKNTGTATASLDPANVFVNGVPLTAAGGAVGTFAVTSLPPGQQSNTLTITLPATGTNAFSSGMSVEVMLQSASGNQYPKVVVLP